MCSVTVRKTEKRPALDPVLAAALARERRYLSLLADPVARKNVGYSLTTPSRADIEAGRTNCSTFVEAVLRDAGYDVDRELTIGALSVAVHDAINIRAESTRLTDGQILRPVVPEVLSAGERAGRVLAELVAAGDPRTQGVALALVASSQGAGINAVDALRPGDTVQTWKLGRDEHGEPVRARGHATFVRRVHAVDLESGEPIILDERSAVAVRRLRVTGVELLGSHFPETGEPDVSGFRAGRSVYTKAPLSLEAELDRWYAVRPSRSLWTAMSG
jgi:hypothetical protein